VNIYNTREGARLVLNQKQTGHWNRWGPFLSERAWGTVREDYSPDGTAWEYFPHDHARSRAYRWNEDGLAGICDRHQYMCFALALWNGRDPILKERLFGLTASEGNHGEDVKEYYFFLDNTPTHTYMKALYKYPQRPFPYTNLVETNRRRSRQELEYELVDTGIFTENRYFDVVIEYAKVTPTDILIRVSATNPGPEAAPLHLLPTLWFRNTWAWGYDNRRPTLAAVEARSSGNGQVPSPQLVQAEHHDLGTYWLACDGTPHLLFTENESNAERLWGVPNRTPFVKDGINDTVVSHAEGRVNPEGIGTKMAAQYALRIEPGATEVVLLRLSTDRLDAPFADASHIFFRRQEEANAFYDTLGAGQSTEQARVQRQALAGLLWSKQFYHYDVDRWLRGDPAGPPASPERSRNTGWQHLSNKDIILMPDTWEYPWYAAWDLAFHTVPMAMIDIDFAKRQLLLLLEDRSMHPNGQLPAYEWAFSDVNPPVHAWAAWQVYRREKMNTGKGDTAFLKRVFNKLMINFTWWVNRKDLNDQNVFQGGFLGLDNIGVFDRSMKLPSGVTLEQSDGTAWMGMYCMAMLAMSLQLAAEDPVYEDLAAKFFDHFMYIAEAINNPAGQGIGLWDPEDEFYYDKLVFSDGKQLPLRVRSLVGLIPLLAVAPISRQQVAAFSWLTDRLDWFAKNRPYLPNLVHTWQDVSKPGQEKPNVLLALTRGPRLRSLLRRMLDPEEFLSEYGIRSLSRYHLAHPYVLDTPQYGRMEVRYAPAESETGAFGGNSNWRGPIWFPINYLLIEALQRYHRFYGDDFQIECPVGSGRLMNLAQVSDTLAQRLTRIFLRDTHGNRPVFGGNRLFQEDPLWRDHIPFYEHFHGDNGAGIGASHQTGWTALIANLLEQTSEDADARRERGELAGAARA
jgi:Mannosylglycerate hydrolase MGH1-like glycoside hydrolase domain